MDELNIYLRIQDPDFEFRINDIMNLGAVMLITEGNPGALSVMSELYRTYQTYEIIEFVNKIWIRKITGSRLWYIYKNECICNISELLSKDLSPFTNEYFWDNFEKYF